MFYLILFATIFVKGFSLYADVAQNLMQLVTPAFYNYSIQPTDLNISSSTVLYNIQSPGRYRLATDLSANPTSSNLAIIKISANNVFLNLNQSVIYLTSGNSQTGITGIELGSGVSNVRICHGFISGLDVSSTGGLVATSAVDLLIENVKIASCTSATAEACAFLLTSCTAAKLTDCSAIANTNTKAGASTTSGTVNGFKLASCSNCILENCYAASNGSVWAGYGIRLESSNYNKFYNCSAFNQTSSSSSGVGFYSNNGAGNIFESCCSVGNNGAASPNCVGFMLYGTEKYTSIAHCKAEANGGTGYAYGIYINSGVTYCEVRENRLICNMGTTSGYGIYDGNANSNILYVRNFAYANGLNNGTVINNYAVTQAPGSAGFQVIQGSYTNFGPLNDSLTGYYNMEIFE